MCVTSNMLCVWRPSRECVSPADVCYSHSRGKTLQLCLALFLHSNCLTLCIKIKTHLPTPIHSQPQNSYPYEVVLFLFSRGKKYVYQQQTWRRIIMTNMMLSLSQGSYHAQSTLLKRDKHHGDTETNKAIRSRGGAEFNLASLVEDNTVITHGLHALFLFSVIFCRRNNKTTNCNYHANIMGVTVTFFKNLMLYPLC